MITSNIKQVMRLAVLHRVYLHGPVSIDTLRHIASLVLDAFGLEALPERVETLVLEIDPRPALNLVRPSSEVTT